MTPQQQAALRVLYRFEVIGTVGRSSLLGRMGGRLYALTPGGLLSPVKGSP